MRCLSCKIVNFVLLVKLMLMSLFWLFRWCVCVWLFGMYEGSFAISHKIGLYTLWSQYKWHKFLILCCLRCLGCLGRFEQLCAYFRIRYGFRKTDNPAGNCMLKVNNRNSKARCAICFKFLFIYFYLFNSLFTVDFSVVISN